MKKKANPYSFFKEYGWRCLFAKLLTSLFSYEKRKSEFGFQILQYKHKIYTNYLSKHYLKASNKKKVSDDTRFEEYIWTAWLQGEEKAPEVIRMNLASMRRYAGKHPLVVITNSNIDQYLDIPKKIINKYQSGIISHAHYTDIIRMMLLAKYGGLWLDASVFLHHPIDEEAFLSPFYSVGFMAKKSRYVSNSKWLLAVLGGRPGSNYLSVISEMLISYWTDHEAIIDYFVFDYLLAALYQNDSSFCKIVDQLPRMPHFTNELKKIMNNPYNQNELEMLLLDNQVYCLSYRDQFQKRTSKGELTNFGHLYYELINE